MNEKGVLSGTAPAPANPKLSPWSRKPPVTLTPMLETSMRAWGDPKRSPKRLNPDHCRGGYGGGKPTLPPRLPPPSVAHDYGTRGWGNNTHLRYPPDYAAAPSWWRRLLRKVAA